MAEIDMFRARLATPNPQPQDKLENAGSNEPAVFDRRRLQKPIWYRNVPEKLRSGE